jgi:hypothetical protein
MYFIISDQMVIILNIEFIQSALMYYCKRKMYSAVNLYSDGVVVDVVTIRENRNFHLLFFKKKKAGRYSSSGVEGKGNSSGGGGDSSSVGGGSSSDGGGSSSVEGRGNSSGVWGSSTGAGDDFAGKISGDVQGFDSAEVLVRALVGFAVRVCLKSWGVKEKILIIGVSHGLLKKKIEDDEDEDEEEEEEEECGGRGFD